MVCSGVGSGAVLERGNALAEWLSPLQKARGGRAAHAGPAEGPAAAVAAPRPTSFHIMHPLARGALAFGRRTAIFPFVGQ